jgi:Zn-dependent protease
VIWYLSELSDNPQALLAFLGAFAVAFATGISFHEFSHAWAAYELGDDTAARRGRLTLNPLAHLDPLGTVLLALVGFGWGKPTPVNPNRLRNGPLRGSAIVAFAGPASNFFFAVLAALPLRFKLIEPHFGSIESLVRNGSGEDIIWLFLFFIVYINIILGIFNLIPIAPLDGFKVAVGVLPEELARGLARLEPWGPGILMSLIVLGFVAPQFDIIGGIISGLSGQIFDLVT